MHNTTDINKKRGETARAMSGTAQQSAHTAIDHTLKAQEINTELLRLTSRAWIEGFRYQAQLSQGMARVFFGQWGNAFARMSRVELPAREHSRGSEVTEGATNGGARKATEPAAEDDAQKKKAEIAAKDAQKNTETAAFPIDGYDEMNVGEVSERLNGLSEAELKRVGEYEEDNKDRVTLRREMEQKTETTS